MRRFAVPAVITTVAVGLLALLAYAISHQGANNSIAYSVQSGHYRRAPEYTQELPAVSGTSAKTMSLAGYSGHTVLVNVFANWCEQCQLESPVLAQAQKVLAAHGGTVLGIAYDESPLQAKAYVRQYGLNYPVLQDRDGDLSGAFGVSGVPDSYLVNPQGKIVWLNLYQLTPAFVHTTLPQLLAKFA